MGRVVLVPAADAAPGGGAEAVVVDDVAGLRHQALGEGDDRLEVEQPQVGGAGLEHAVMELDSRSGLLPPVPVAGGSRARRGRGRGRRAARRTSPAAARCAGRDSRRGRTARPSCRSARRPGSGRRDMGTDYPSPKSRSWWLGLRLVLGESQRNGLPRTDASPGNRRRAGSDAPPGKTPASGYRSSLIQSGATPSEPFPGGNCVAGVRSLPCLQSRQHRRMKRP